MVCSICPNYYKGNKNVGKEYKDQRSSKTKMEKINNRKKEIIFQTTYINLKKVRIKKGSTKKLTTKRYSNMYIIIKIMLYLGSTKIRLTHLFYISGNLQ